MHYTYRDQSKLNWGVSDAKNIDSTRLQIGCLQRIADASELMAKNHAELVRERDHYKNLYESYVRETRTLDRRIASLKGVITKKQQIIEELGARAK